MKNIIIGLGKMGLNLVKNFNDNGVSIEGYDINEKIAEEYKHELFNFNNNLESLLNSHENVLIMLLLPSGDITDNMVNLLHEKLKTGDFVIDFSNSHYQNSIKYYRQLNNVGIKYFDCGLSGGVRGAREGACMMLGNSTEIDGELHDLLSKVCCKNGFSYHQQPGSGHYLKMVHNGIEYGMMQAIAEGLQLLKLQPHYDYELEKVLFNWSNGSIIESFLVKNIYEEVKKDRNLSTFNNRIFSSGEANWMVKESIDLSIPLPVITQSLMERYRSQIKDFYGNRAVSAMRYHFGGHNETD